MATKHLGATMALSGVPSQFHHLGAYSDGKGNRIIHFSLVWDLMGEE